MVAEHTSTPTKTRRRGPTPQIPLPQKLRVRTLYLVQQLSLKEIADQTGMTRPQVANLIYREKWTPVKQRIKSSLAQKASERMKASVEQEVNEMVESVAIQSSELGVGTLAKARSTLDRQDVNAARDLQAYSQAAKNFVGIYRQARELDQQTQEGKLGSVVVFLGDLPRVSSRPDPINVTPITPALPSPVPKEAPVSSGEGKDTPLATD